MSKFIYMGFLCGLIFALAGCVAQPPVSFGSVQAPEKKVEITQHEYWADAGWACFNEADLGHKLASIAAMGPFGVMFGYRGCAVVYSDRCVVHVIKGDKTTLRHELAHCDGWRHDADPNFETVRMES